MSRPALSDRERRVLVLAPTARDARLTSSVLRASSIPCNACADAGELCEQLEVGASAVLIAEEELANGAQTRLAALVSQQPPWSDLPVLVLTRHGANSPAAMRAVATLGNVTLLERPTRIAALISAVHTALRARQRQYQIRAHMAERERVENALREADRRKDEFLATLAHELRNPLAPIANSLHIMQRTAPDSGLQWCFEVIQRQVRQLSRLVDDLLDVSRITRGKIVLRKSPVELASVVRSAVETSRPLITAAGHELSVELPAEDVIVEVDAVRLAQALANLLNNAAKYTPPRGRIRVRAHVDEDSIVIAVSDNGLGLPRDMLSRIFEMFMQAAHTAQAAQGGLGIGLTLVRSFVELHGGSVTAHSAGANMGSEFVIRLPHDRTRIAASVPGEASSAQAPPARPHRILIVEDNPDGAQTLSALLQELGNEVRAAADGRQAVQAVTEFAPDVVLLDLGLPQMDGFEAARIIRRQTQGRALKLIALTGWGQEEARRRSREAGCDHHLVKPVDLDALQRILSEPDIVPAARYARGPR
jgi:signal transduction histidine kinase